MELQIYLNILCYIFTINLKLINTEKFLPVSDMEKLLQNEVELISQYENFITKQQNQLDTLKLKVLELKSENREASDQSTEYFGNPINVFSFTRRLTIDWQEIEQHITNDKFVGVIQSFKNFSNFPKRADLKSSIGALFWLQDIYNLSASSLVKGVINGIDYNTFLTTRDCIELGFRAYENMDFYHSRIWLTEALNIFKNDEVNFVDKKTILRSLAESHFQNGDVNNAVAVSNDIIKLVNDTGSQRAKAFYESKASIILPEKDFMTKFPGHLYEDFLNADDNYPQLCRVKQNYNILKSNNLKCRYENNNISFLFIAPFKREILSIDPLLVLFHDVISDEEIKLFQEFVKDDLQYSRVFDPHTNKNITVKYRISKDKFITRGKEPKFVLDIKKRAGDITTLNMKSSEGVNINHYEIGGYYAPHYDFSLTGGFAYGNVFNSAGNRISTLIFYMNDVDQGGATVFPEIKISVIPKKGSALFWFNLHPSGEIDRRTLHGGCPVLVGHKWISTIWTRELFQDIHRPCVAIDKDNKI